MFFWIVVGWWRSDGNFEPILISVVFQTEADGGKGRGEGAAEYGQRFNQQRQQRQRRWGIRAASAGDGKNKVLRERFYSAILSGKMAIWISLLSLCDECVCFKIPRAHTDFWLSSAVAVADDVMMLLVFVYILFVVWVKVVRFFWLVGLAGTRANCLYMYEVSGSSRL